MAPQIPTQRALAIAGEWIAGGVGVHETALASPDIVNLDGRVVVPGLADAHVHFPTWALAQTQVSLAGCASLDEALARIARRGAARRPGLAPRARLAQRRLGRRRASRRGQRLDEVTGDAPAAMVVGRPPFAVAQLGRARARRRRSRGRGRRGRARRAGRADGGAAGGGGVAIPGRYLETAESEYLEAMRAGPEGRERAGRDRGARQGRRARRARALAAARGGRQPLGKGLAEPAARSRRGAPHAGDPVGLRQLRCSRSGT